MEMEDDILEELRLSEESGTENGAEEERKKAEEKQQQVEAEAQERRMRKKKEVKWQERMEQTMTNLMPYCKASRDQIKALCKPLLEEVEKGNREIERMERVVKKKEDERETMASIVEAMQQKEEELLREMEKGQPELEMERIASEHNCETPEELNARLKLVYALKKELEKAEYEKSIFQEEAQRERERKAEEKLEVMKGKALIAKLEKDNKRIMKELKELRLHQFDNQLVRDGKEGIRRKEEEKNGLQTMEEKWRRASYTRQEAAPEQNRKYQKEVPRGYHEQTQEITDGEESGEEEKLEEEIVREEWEEREERKMGSNPWEMMIMAQVVPEPTAFSGEEAKDSLETFAEVFHMKYGAFAARQQLILLESKFLKGKALKVFKGIPKEEKKTVSRAMEALAGRLRVSKEDESRRAKANWERLRLQEGQSYTDFCMKVDEVARKAFARVGRAELSSTKMTKLQLALEKNEQLGTIIEARLLDEPEELHYEKAKLVLTRLEMRSEEKKKKKEKEGEKVKEKGKGEERKGEEKKIEQKGSSQTNVRTGQSMNVNHGGQSQPMGQNQAGKERNSDDVRNQRGDRCEFCGNFGAYHLATCPNVKCYKCNQKGHTSPRCPNTNQPPQWRREEQRKGEEEKTVQVVEEKGKGEEEVKKEREKEKERAKEETGPKTVEKGRIGRSEVELLVDSGSSISILAKNIWNRLIRENSTEWFRNVVVERSTKNQVYTANGQPMQLTQVVKLNTAMRSRTREVVYHIADIQRASIILGTNAFKDMGVKMKFSEEPRELRLVKDVRLVPSAWRVVEGQVEGVIEREKEEVLLNPKVDELAEAVARMSKEGRIMVQVVNFGKEPKVLKKGQVLAVVEWEEMVVREWKVNLEKIAEDRLKQKESEQKESGVDEQEVCAAVGEREKGDRLKEMWEQLEREEKVMNKDMRRVVEQFQDVFAISDLELTQTQVAECEIELEEGARAIKQRPRPIPLAVKPEIQKMIGKMLEQKVIRVSKSPWASPVVLVKKKDGTIRMCIDYRKVNTLVRKNAHPLPHIEATLQSLKGKKVFTTFDLLAGYWQIPLKEESKEITAFALGSELFEWNVLPFGLVTSPAVFQATMENVLGDLLGESAHVYVDDLLIASENMEEHIQDVAQALARIRASGLKLKATKCHIARSEVEYLGHKISGEGVKTEEAKVEKMRKFARPENGKELHSFLGLVGYYRKFIMNFAKLAAPLTPLTSEKVAWKWEREQEEAFVKLGEAVCKAPVLAQPDVEAAISGERPFLIFTDASRLGVGAVLSQEAEGGEQHPIAFASKALSPAEKNYHITDLEALAVIYALRRFKTIVYGAKIIVYTDHKPLTALLKGTPLADRLLRWSLEIQDHDVKIVYISGKANVVADALSRGGCAVQELQETGGLAEMEKIVNATEEEEDVLEVERWLEWLKEEEEGWRDVIEKLEQRDERGVVKVKGVKGGVHVEHYGLVGKSLRNTENEGVSRRVVPERARPKILREMHEGRLAGHFGVEKMLRHLQKKFFWPRMRLSVEKWVKGCSKCLCANDQPKLTAPLKPYETSYPLEVVAADLIDMGLSLQGNRYLLTILDLFTKFGAAVPIPDKKAETVVKVFLERWVLGEGRAPDTLLTDQGTEFVNTACEEMAKMLKIKHITTKGYHSRANGAVERFNKTVVHIMKKKAMAAVEWDQVVPYAVYAYNASSHDTTGETPFFLMTGRDPKGPLEMEGEDGVAGICYADSEEYKVLMVRELLEAHRRVKAHAKQEQEKYKRLFDSKHNTSSRRFPEPGCRVLVEIPSERMGVRCPKMTNKWRGPYRVLSCTDNSATVSAVMGRKEEVLVVPFDHLRIVPPEVSNEPIITVKKRRGKKGEMENGKGIREGEMEGRQDRREEEEVCLVWEEEEDWEQQMLRAEQEFERESAQKRKVYQDENMMFFRKPAFFCKCPKPCIFVVPGTTGPGKASTTAPRQLVVMHQWLQHNPELKHHPAELMVLSKGVVPFQSTDVPVAVLRDLARCTTIVPTLRHDSWLSGEFTAYRSSLMLEFGRQGPERSVIIVSPSATANGLVGHRTVTLKKGKEEEMLRQIPWTQEQVGSAVWILNPKDCNETADEYNLWMSLVPEEVQVWVFPTPDAEVDARFLGDGAAKLQSILRVKTREGDESEPTGWTLVCPNEPVPSSGFIQLGLLAYRKWAFEQYWLALKEIILVRNQKFPPGVHIIKTTTTTGVTTRGTERTERTTNVDSEKEDGECDGGEEGAQRPTARLPTEGQQPRRSFVNGGRGARGGGRDGARGGWGSKRPRTD